MRPLFLRHHCGFALAVASHEVNPSLFSSSGFPRTKALVLELLAAVCLVRGGHEIILSAFDNFKEVRCGARRWRYAIIPKQCHSM